MDEEKRHFRDKHFGTLATWAERVALALFVGSFIQQIILQGSGAPLVIAGGISSFMVYGVALWLLSKS